MVFLPTVQPETFNVDTLDTSTTKPETAPSLKSPDPASPQRNGSTELGGPPSSSHNSSRLPSSKKRRKSKFWLIVLLAVVVVGAASSVALALRLRSEPFNGPTWEVKEDYLTQTVNERGALESEDNGDI